MAHYLAIKLDNSARNLGERITNRAPLAHSKILSGAVCKDLGCD